MIGRTWLELRSLAHGMPGRNPKGSYLWTQGLAVRSCTLRSKIHSKLCNKRIDSNSSRHINIKISDKKEILTMNIQQKHINQASQKRTSNKTTFLTVKCPKIRYKKSTKQQGSPGPSRRTYTATVCVSSGWALPRHRGLYLRWPNLKNEQNFHQSIFNKTFPLKLPRMLLF